MMFTRPTLLFGVLSAPGGWWMTYRHIPLLIIAVVALVFSTGVAWEFGIEDHLIEPFVERQVEEEDHFKWEFIFTSTFAVFFVMLLISPILIRMINERDKSIANAHQLDVERRQALERSDFVTSLSHELRTPLNGILAFSDILLMDEENPEKRNHIDLIKKSGKSLQELIDDLLDLAKIESSNFEIECKPFRLMDVTGNMDAYWKDLIHHDVDFSVCADPDLPVRVYGDAQRIEQIFRNLISNAAKFTQHGHIRVSISGEETDSGFTLIGEVEDTGCGMSEEFLDRIFGRFSQDGTTNDHRNKGSGLGLSICKNLTRLMGGDIAVESKLDEGTTFRFTVALRTQAAEPQAEAA